MAITCDLPDETTARLQKLAEATGRSFNDVVVDIIERWLWVTEPMESARNGNSLQPGNKSGKADQDRPKRMALTAEESLRRMKDFKNRKDEFIASIRKSKSRDIPA